MATPTNQRVFRSSRIAKAALILSDDRAVLAGSDQNFIVCDQKGITIKGAISFITPSQEVRVGGLWTQTLDTMRMLPSTIVTPLPNQFISPPVGGIIGMKDIITYALGAVAV